MDKKATKAQIVKATKGAYDYLNGKMNIEKAAAFEAWLNQQEPEGEVMLVYASVRQVLMNGNAYRNRPK